MHDDSVSNPTTTQPSFGDVLDDQLSRRSVLSGGLGTLALLFVNPTAFTRDLVRVSALLGFQKVAISQEDTVTVPPGYLAQVLYAWGDPVSAGPTWDPSAANTWEEQQVQAGMHHDGMHFFPMPYGSSTSDHGLLVVNHEYTDEGLLHVGGMSPWTPEKVRKSQAANGVSIVEVQRGGSGWSVVRPSALARRVTAYTPMRVSGPAAGAPAMRTEADPTGTLILGTLNNCANGYTPWGTYLTCEENFNGYFANGSASPSAQQSRYGIAATSEYRWNEHDGRFDTARHPNEFNRFGWVVEIDPFDPNHTPVKRTALGRIKHEGAATTLASDGRVVVYMGDDERFEYIYKFVSRDRYDPSDRAANATLLDNGTLYVARFNADGGGEWIALVQGQNGLDASAGFATQADVVVRARQAGDRVGATRMDRPEWIAVHPQSGQVYCTLTNNSLRGTAGQPGLDAANPRAANVYGHVIRWTETGGPAGTRFGWSLFAMAGDPSASTPAQRGNVRGDAFGSPDGLWFDGRGVLWIQTDVSTSALYRTDYANLGNNQMLAADPDTAEVRRFLTGPRFCEVTGVAQTPDMRTMFVNIQHPGEPAAGPNDPRNPGAFSTWPDGPGIARPRSATVVITKDDGGVIGA